MCKIGENEIVEEVIDIKSWAYEPRIIKRKGKDIVECIFRVKSKAKAYMLYQNQRQNYKEWSIKILTKKTDIEYVQKIGFLIGLHVRLADPENYIQEISKAVKLNSRSIKIKKRVTYEKGVAKKVLMTFTIQLQVREINEKLFKTLFRRFKYTSFKYSDADQRLGAMHNNNITNIKGHFEMLYDINLDDTVYKGTESYKLQELILSEKYGEENLFLAIEEG